MGQFSWLYADTGEQMVDNKVADSYLLVPEPFQERYGHAIHERCYDGYGRFGGYDVYDLILQWNRAAVPEIVKKMENGRWGCSTTPKEREDLLAYYEGKPTTCEIRHLGIKIACYDEDNESLPYPIKITSKEMDYEEAKVSPRDPKQGWEDYEEEY